MSPDDPREERSPPRPEITLPGLNPQNRFLTLGEDYYSRVEPEPLPDARLLHVNRDLAAELGLSPDSLDSPEFLALMSGNARLSGGCEIATVYAGHQFGVFVPQLGDGRAILLAQVQDTQGHWQDIQLKGAGPTPYSRFADGRAVLRSSIREYLAGSALHHLGIPSTRALSLVGSSLPLRRETIESAAVISRIAPSHVRFGQFEFFYYQGRHEALAPLADQVIEQHFPELFEHPQRHAAWLRIVVERSARLMAQWQTVGFCHGVMNTDNFSVLGLTLDYGPYGFLDAFDAHHICNHTDEGGRYAYDRQPEVAHWNCSRLLQACLPLLHEVPEQAVEIAQAILDAFPPTYTEAVTRRWRAKLGLVAEESDDPELINRLLTIMHRSRADFTRSFRMLSELESATDAALRLRDYFSDLEAFDAWLGDYRARLRREHSDDAQRRQHMNAVNPKYVLRNWMAQGAIEQAQQGDATEIDRLMRLLARPYDEQPDMERYFAEPPAWAQHIEVSCSS